MVSLIIGARGLVGSALARQIPDAILGISVEPTEPNQVYFDVTKYETMFKVFSKYRPDIVYMCASIAHVDKCEDTSTDVVNIKGAITVLRLCEMFDAKLVYFSSSYVFDGKSKHPYRLVDTPNPINHYGHQKVVVENAIFESEKFMIVRTVGVYGEERLKKNFAKQVISSVFSGKRVYAPTDQKMNPILSDDLAKVTISLAQHANGLWHVSGDACITKYEFAKKIAGFFGMAEFVIGKTSDEMGQKAKRPMNGCLNCSDLKSVANIEVPSFGAGLIRFLSQEYNG